MWNEHLKSVEKSQTLLLNEQSRQLESGGREVFKFGFGQSPFPPLPRAVAALSASAGAKDYTPVQGLKSLRERVAAFHAQAEGLEVDADDVLVAPGSKLLLYAVMAAFRRADVLMAAPAWVSYAPQAELLGHTAVRLETDYDHRWRVTPDTIEAAVRRKADPSLPTLMILNHPGNPDGLGYSDEELDALAAACRRHRVLVISDEIYGLLHHEGRHVSLARHYPEATIVTGGLSKWCGAGGWRLGVAMLPRGFDPAFKEAVLGIASETYSCAPLPVQLAACEAYRWEDDVRDYLAHQRRLLAAIGQRVAATLAAAGVQVHRPEGGFYLFPDFSADEARLRAAGIDTSARLCERLLADTGVALLPGTAFGMAPRHLCARLAYVEFDGEAALAASREIGLQRPLGDREMELIFGKTLRGTNEIARWLAAQ
jgi:aspartate aminotransferase